MRQISLLDRILSEFDTALRSVLPPQQRGSQRCSPANNQPNASLSDKEKKHIAGLMRVNHSGEVCAQALYQGQALTAKLPHTKAKMAQAAAEEVDHLAWCEKRLQELDASPSHLNAFWYGGSFLIGALAGLAGDQYSLGFVAETEKQVSQHLENHLKQIPPEDLKTQAILKQMHEDESHHADMAIEAGAAELPFAIKKMMQVTSRLLTKSSYYI